jgi:ATP-dependent helicase/nuclease subunit B
MFLDIAWEGFHVTVQKRTPSLAPQNPLPKTDYFKTKKHHFSVSEIETYLKCPFKYYAIHHLKLKKNPEEDLEPSPEAKGSLVHRVLQRLLQENDKEYREGLEYETYRQRLIKKLAPLIEEEITKDERFQHTNKTLIDFYAYRVFKTITEVLHREVEAFKNKTKRTIPQYFEWSFGETVQRPLEINTPEGKITLNGRVDRIDIHHSSKNFTVIDYKTGEADSLADIKAGRSIQLPLYLMACQRYLYKNYQPSGAFFYTLKENEVKGFSLEKSADSGTVSDRAQISLDEWNTLVQTTIDVVINTVEKIRAGQFEPAPQKDHICSYCEFSNLCGYRFQEK